MVNEIVKVFFVPVQDSRGNSLDTNFLFYVLDVFELALYSDSFLLNNLNLLDLRESLFTSPYFFNLLDIHQVESKVA
jgi:hypothetical protein